MCFPGDFASKQMASTRPLSVLSRSLSLRLLKKPPVWYCPRIFPLFDRSQSRAFPDFKRRPNFLPLPLLPLRRSRSMMFAHLCLGGTSYTLLSWLPTYFKETFPHSKVVLSSDDEIQPRKTSHAALVPARAAWPLHFQRTATFILDVFVAKPVCSCRDGCTT